MCGNTTVRTIPQPAVSCKSLLLLSRVFSCSASLQDKANLHGRLRRASCGIARPCTHRGDDRHSETEYDSAMAFRVLSSRSLAPPSTLLGRTDNTLNATSTTNPVSHFLFVKFHCKLSVLFRTRPDGRHSSQATAVCRTWDAFCLLVDKTTE